MVARCRHERGSALLIALVAAFLVAATVLLVASYLKARIDTFRLAERDVQLAALSDAAMAETLASLADDDRFSGVSRRALGDGFISSTVTESGPHRVRVEAAGFYNDWTAVIDAEVDLQTFQPRVLKWRSSRSLSGESTGLAPSMQH